MREAKNLSNGVSWVAGLIAVLAIVASWHASGLAGPVEAGTYWYSSQLYSVIGVGSILVYVVVSGMLGWVGTRPKALALGMVTPWLVAFVIEVTADQTSHNLFPFEILIRWVPAFVLSYYAAKVGRGLRQRAVEQTAA